MSTSFTGGFSVLCKRIGFGEMACRVRRENRNKSLVRLILTFFAPPGHPQVHRHGNFPELVYRLFALVVYESLG